MEIGTDLVGVQVFDDVAPARGGTGACKFLLMVEQEERNGYLEILFE